MKTFKVTVEVSDFGRHTYTVEAFNAFEARETAIDQADQETYDKLTHNGELPILRSYSLRIVEIQEA